MKRNIYQLNNKKLAKKASILPFPPHVMKAAVYSLPSLTLTRPCNLRTIVSQFFDAADNINKKWFFLRLLLNAAHIERLQRRLQISLVF